MGRVWGDSGTGDALMEEWQQIRSHPDYEISSFGRVRRLINAPRGIGKAGDIKSFRLDPAGYPFVTLSYDGKKTSLHLHVLVCRAFCGEKPSDLHEVAHWDGNRSNAKADNLRWATHVENQADILRHGGHPNRGKGKISASDARYIKFILHHGNMSQRAIAGRYNVSRGVIDHIWRGNSWKWV